MTSLVNIFRNRYYFIADVLICFVSYTLITLVRYPVSDFVLWCPECFAFAGIAACIYCVMMFIAGVYSIYWIYAGTRDYLRLLIAALLGAVVCCILGFVPMPLSVVYPKLNIASNILIVAFILGLRFCARATVKLIHIVKGRGGKRVLIIGAGQLAAALLRDINDNDRLHYTVVGLIDDNGGKKGQVVHGAKVLGDRNDIIKICRREAVREIIFAIYTISSKQKIEMLDICSKTGCKVRIVPGFEESLSVDESLKKMRDVEIEDLLERDPVKLDNNLIGNQLRDKIVLVTGGGGSIGSELCRQIVKFKPAKLIILDIYENTTYELEMELEDKYPDLNLEVLIASIRDEERLNEIFEKYKPDLVFHAAAHKHVPLMEDSPSEAINNNVFGTYNVVKCADLHRVKRFVMISTDKAVNPTNVMGATKRLCEMIVQTYSKRSSTKFAIVRFGNVLGSHGSVIPRFKMQIAEGGPVTVTHPEITRFFMTIPEAAQLVLQAAAYAEGGEIFVLDMGKPVKIKDLAEKLIFLSGYVPNVDIKIEYCGLRPGEKLYEELLMSEEGLKKTKNSKIFIGKPIDINDEEMQQKLAILKGVVRLNNNDLIKRALADVVPTYTVSQITGKEDVGYNPEADTYVDLKPAAEF